MSLSRPLLPLVLSVPLAVAVPRPGEEPAGAPAGETLAAMGWLAGAWSGDMWGGRFVAHYSTPEGGKILSHSRLVVDGEERSFEFELFEPDAEGDAVVLRPFPGGRPATALELASHDAGARRAVFENPRKDFPTRIVYERRADELVITLSDPHGGSDEVQTFRLKRP